MARKLGKSVRFSEREQQALDVRANLPSFLFSCRLSRRKLLSGFLIITPLTPALIRQEEGAPAGERPNLYVVVVGCRYLYL